MCGWEWDIYKHSFELARYALKSRNPSLLNSSLIPPKLFGHGPFLLFLAYQRTSFID